MAAISEDAVDCSDIPPSRAEDWQGATRGKFYRPIKRQLTVRIDSVILEWLKSQGRAYQSRMNTILRTAMQDALRHS